MSPTPGEVRIKAGKRPGAEVYEIEYATDPPPSQQQTRQTMPTLEPPPMPSEVNDASAGQRSEALQTAKPARREASPVKPPSVTAPGMPRVSPPKGMPSAWRERESSPSRVEPSGTSLGLGVPGPSFGGDTELDPLVAIAPTTRRVGAPDDAELDFDLGPSADPGMGFGLEESAPDSNDALDLVGRRDDEFGIANIAGSLGIVGKESIPPTPRKADPMSELRERYALGDFSGALTIAEGLLEDQPTHADAQRYAESCRDVLRQMYAARLGPLEQVPVVAIPGEQLRWLTLDHRSGFLLSHVDGVSTLEEILDISGMNPLEAMRIIYDLLQQKVIALQ